MNSDEAGVVVPLDPTGKRSSSALGSRIVADALRGVDPGAALAAEREKSWRTGYLVHFRRLTEAGLVSRDAATRIADDGLGAVRRQVHYRHRDGRETALEDLAGDPTQPPLATVEVTGSGVAEVDFKLPLHGSWLSGTALERQLDSWAAAGVLEPSAADRVREVMSHPEWLSLPGRTLVALGASSEMGPLPSLLRWGARVAAVGRPRPEIWQRTLGAARTSAGTVIVPVTDGRVSDSDEELAARAGVGVMTDIDATAQWIAGLAGDLVLGNYLYADGAANLRLSAAADAVTTRVQGVRPNLALAFLATATDVFAVPAETAGTARRAYESASTAARGLRAPVRTLSGGRLLQAQYPTASEPSDAEPDVYDGLLPAQGPNYALAKRLQRWRATSARAGGATVSLNVAPPTRTRSVLKNRVFAAAYSGAHHFGVDIFEPATASTIMAALLVADLHSDGGPRHDEPWQDEAYAAIHGGLWRGAYQPRTVLPLAAMAGLRAAAGRRGHQ